jgi:corrinoid protein of di/trimethylamine methyltransferase
MNREKSLSEVRNSLVNLDMKGAPKAAKEAVELGIAAPLILSEGLGKGMEDVGKKYENKEYFLAELLIAGEVMARVLKVLEPYLKMKKAEATGKIVIGTVEGDLHDLGKSIVITLLKSAGFEVYDLGIDVPAEKFAEKVKETKADILAVSALLTTSMMEMKNVIDALKKAGVRESVKVIIGGHPVSEEFAKEIGADAYGKNAFIGSEICKKWVQKRQKSND